MKRSRQPVEINIDELRRTLDRARREPISEADYLKMNTALDVLAERSCKHERPRQPELSWRSHSLPMVAPRRATVSAVRRKDMAATVPARIPEPERS